MNSRLKIGIIITILIIAVVVAAFLIVLRQEHFPALQQRVPPGHISGDFQFFYDVFTVISTINIALLIILVIMYADVYVKTRSPFSIGLVIFAIVFLVKDLTASPLFTGLYGFRAYGLGPFAFIPSLFELAALSILLYLSAKY